MNIFLVELNIHKSFKAFFDRKDIQEMLDNIEYKLLCGQKYTDQFYPYPKDVLRFAVLDLSNVKCIILGMDPYPSDFIDNDKIVPVSTGRSFEVKNLLSWQDNFKQSSLQNILKTLYYNELHKNDVKINDIRKDIKDGKFKVLEPSYLWDSLEKQGVMWLNATLTVKPHKSNKHAAFWQDFMDELIKYILEYKKKNNEKSIKWLIWGENAKNRIAGLVDKKDMIYTCHPASRVNNTFVRDNCFQFVKDIDWIENKK